jgi:hypothetical protein
MVRGLNHEVRDTPRCTCHRIPVASCKLFGDKPATQARRPEAVTVAQNAGQLSIMTHARSELWVLRKIRNARRASGWICAITCRPQARVRIQVGALKISQQIFPAWRKHLHHIRQKIHMHGQAVLTVAGNGSGICLKAGTNDNQSKGSTHDGTEMKQYLQFSNLPDQLQWELPQSSKQQWQLQARKQCYKKSNISLWVLAYSLSHSLGPSVPPTLYIRFSCLCAQ